MELKRVRAVYFSATGTTKRGTLTIAQALAQQLGLPCDVCDFTLPTARTEPLRFAPDTLVVCGTPVYAGRVPNVLLPFLRTLEGNGAAAVPVVAFGNRNFDDALIELRDLLEDGGCHTVAAAALIGEHSFSRTLGAGRPDATDLEQAAAFARQVADKLPAWSAAEGPVAVEGVPQPYRGYYQPRDRAGNPVDIRKVKPLTADTCNDCGLCAQLCPMGSISPTDVRAFTGICIKCGACIKGCPQGAKYYDDAGYLYHRDELEQGYARRASPGFFL